MNEAITLIMYTFRQTVTMIFQLTMISGVTIGSVIIAIAIISEVIALLSATIKNTTASRPTREHKGRSEE